MIDLKQAAKLIGISAFTVGCMVRGRRIPHYRFGRRIMFDEAELAAWIRDRHVPMIAPQDGSEQP
jgi:excisionase family DNA binding protein